MLQEYYPTMRYQIGTKFSVPNRSHQITVRDNRDGCYALQWDEFDKPPYGLWSHEEIKMLVEKGQFIVQEASIVRQILAHYGV